MPKRIPIAAARAFAETEECKQVVILAWDGKRQHVVTYGIDKQNCKEATNMEIYLKDI